MSVRKPSNSAEVWRVAILPGTSQVWVLDAAYSDSVTTTKVLDAMSIWMLRVTTSMRTCATCRLTVTSYERKDRIHPEAGDSRSNRRISAVGPLILSLVVLNVRSEQVPTQPLGSHYVRPWPVCKLPEALYDY